jgi:hypothetical protein
MIPAKKIFLISFAASVISLVIGLMCMLIAVDLGIVTRSRNRFLHDLLCDLYPIFYVLAAFLFVCGVIFCLCWIRVELTVTNKRIYGKAAFGKRVDLPIDSISAIGTSMLWGIDIGTSSGRIHFKFVENNDKIHSVLSKLLVERQQEKTLSNIQTASSADELKKFKELLDSGAITQEEFNLKKERILGLYD